MTWVRSWVLQHAMPNKQFFWLIFYDILHTFHIPVHNHYPLSIVNHLKPLQLNKWKILQPFLEIARMKSPLNLYTSVKSILWHISLSWVFLQKWPSIIPPFSSLKTAPLPLRQPFLLGPVMDVAGGHQGDHNNTTSTCSWAMLTSSIVSLKAQKGQWFTDKSTRFLAVLRFKKPTFV